jgi:hypothetical protein
MPDIFATCAAKFDPRSTIDTVKNRSECHLADSGGGRLGLVFADFLALLDE